MRSTRSAEDAECGVWKARSVENAECGKRGVWKTRSVEMQKKIHAIKNFKKRDQCAYKLLRINDFNNLYFPFDLIECENYKRKR